MLVTYGGFIVFIVGMVVHANSNTIPVVALFGFVVALLGLCAALGAMVYAMFGFRCPRCKEAWGYVALYTGGPFSIAQRFRFCPYCVLIWIQSLTDKEMKPHGGCWCGRAS